MNLILALLFAVAIAYFWIAVPRIEGSTSPFHTATDADEKRLDVSASSGKKRKGKKGKKASKSKAGKNDDTTETVEEHAIPAESTNLSTDAPQPPTIQITTAAEDPKLENEATKTSSSPDMDTDDDDDDEFPMARVLKVKSQDELSATDVEGEEDGWQMVEVHSKKQPRPKASYTMASQPLPAAPVSSEQLTKKQRENMRKAERVKGAKQSQQEEQEARLRAYRKEQEKAWVAKEVEKDKQRTRQKALSKIQHGTTQENDTGTFTGGKGIWD